MREQAANDKPVAAAITLSENASSFGAISRLNQHWDALQRLIGERGYGD
jgi:hypothetical protein